MADGTRVYEPLADGSTTVVTDVDSKEIDFGGGVLRDRQRMLLAGTTANSDVPALSTAPTGNEFGLLVRQVGPTTIQGNVGVNGTVTVGGSVTVSGNVGLVNGTTVGVTGNVHSILVDSNGVPYTEAHLLPVSVGDLTISQLTVAFPDSVVSSANCIDTPLGANAVYTGTWEEVTSFSAITAIIFTDQASALNGAVVQFSDDGTNIIRSVAASVPAGVGLTFLFGPEARYYRIVYTNGPVAQTVIRAQVILHYQTPVAPQLPLAATTTDVSLAQQVQSHLKARMTNGVYIPLRGDSTGRLEVAIEQPLALDSATIAALNPASIEVSNDVGNPIPISGTVTITDGAGPVTVDGTVAVSSLPEVEVKNDSGSPLSVSGTINVGNFPTSTEISNDVGNPLPVAGTVTVSNPTANPETGLAKDATFAKDADGGIKTHIQNFPGTQPVSGPLTDAQLRASAVPVSDLLTVSEVLTDLSGVGTVQTATFSAARKLIYVLARGGVARAGIGQTPSASLGIYCDDGVPTIIPVVSSTVSIYIPVGVTVTVWGLS